MTQADKSEQEKELLKKIIEEKLKNLRDKNSKSKRLLKLISSLTLSLTILLASTTLLFFITDSKEMPNYYFSKSIKKEIATIIYNNGDLETIKHLFNTKEIKRKKVTDLFLKNDDEYYSEATPLTYVINDLKVDYYKQEKKDSGYLNSLIKIIELHNQVNPFDKLESNQKFAFENIRTKLDTNYILIQEDLNRMADELNNKNVLVTKYLDKSNLSY